MNLKEKLANAIDIGYIKKCAEYGLNFNNPQQKNIVLSLMQYTYKDLQNNSL